MKNNEVGPLDLKTSQKSSEVFINTPGPVSIQPIVSNICGSPTYTLEVSNDNESFIPYDDLSTGISLHDSIQIDYPVIPWEYMRISTSCQLNDSGIATFLFIY